jgi:8-oxo-dGTP pyrophosphatase MutT (NUDIX family)
MDNKNRFSAYNMDIISSHVVQQKQSEFEIAQRSLFEQCGVPPSSKVSNIIFTVLDKETHVLVATRRFDNNRLQIPGGKGKEGELFFETGIRETTEEVGIDITQIASAMYICTTFLPYINGNSVSLLGTILTFVPSENVARAYLPPGREAISSGPWHWESYAKMIDKSMRKNGIHHTTALRFSNSEIKKQMQLFLSTVNAPRIF